MLGQKSSPALQCSGGGAQWSLHTLLLYPYTLSACENILFAPQNRFGLWTHRTDTPATFAYPFRLLKYQKYIFIINICMQVIPEIPDARANYSCAAFAWWSRSCVGEGRQVATPRQGWTPHCPGAAILEGRVSRDIFHHNSRAKSRCAKSWNHSLLSWNEFHKASCESPLSSLNFPIPSISRKITNRG